MNLTPGWMANIDFEDKNKIVGGQEARPHSHPHQAALILHSSQGRMFCGGSLVCKLQRYLISFY